ncbi:uncharacterized protein K452DRAFT_55698 [Aplosporella prunicola CBS 121167]|uniref:Amino acid permease/ SLC12A domain-containing protein n=1 Tax=Aplosporella prunicola CBS 121167 TaxID=1176127 RepID=A0A6A6BB07_9PEZI|nr:uncharacterized protein K452DRAFT_55698 [Aplosporella prunicola CBS 121167]KAF2140425.1 hypothetical protein K452DRAFT_55698 [Aplosporella prunicola CBS 121167]
MSELHELDSKDGVHESQRDISREDGRGGVDEDREILARLGKKQVLKRDFGFLSMLGFALTVLATWEGLLTTFSQGLQNGGPSGLVYGYIIVWVATMSSFSVIAELSSIAPTAGGQYYWVAVLAPASSKKFYSYITGWLTTIAWVAATASGGYLTGTIIQGLIVLNNMDSYVAEGWHGTLLFWACVFVALFVNTVIGRLLPAIESLMLVLHVLGFFAILIPLVYMSESGSAESVFNTFLNEGGWPTQGLSFCVGMMGCVYSFAGADAAVHMSEEIVKPATNVPRCIATSVIINGALGFGMLLALLFSIGDVDAALNTPTGYPMIEIFQQGVKSNAGASVMASIAVVLALASTTGFIATASRLTWAFARDNGLPFSRWLSKVEKRTLIPINAIIVVTVLPCLLALINIGSSTVFNDVISLAVSGFYASYLVPSALLLWRRMTGGIANATTGSGMHAIDLTDPERPQLAWGPWRIPGILGTLNNAFACLWMIFLVFFSFWPPAVNPSAADMNYAVLVTGAVIIFSIFYYLVWGHKTYRGPLVEIEVSGGRS